MYPTIEGITFEENSERLKIVLPVKHNWFLLIAYTLTLITGIGLLIGSIRFGVQIGMAKARFSLLFVVMILIFLLMLYYLLKYVFRQWQFNVANREILFFNDEELIVRRPVSILGITTTFDRQYMRPLVYNEQYKSLSFEYGSRTIVIALNLPSSQTVPLATYINERYFPNHDEDDEDEL
jgi:cbb3-type cytochrome oxidase subunit 3